MDKFKNVFLGLAAVAILVLGGHAFSKNTVIQKTIETKTGSVVSDTVFTPCFTVNGFTSCYNSTGLGVATNTICSFKSPSATSTLVRLSASLKTSTTTASLLIWGKGTQITATTTLISDPIAIGANAQVVASASTTNFTDVNKSKTEIAPNTWVNLNQVGNSTGLGTVSPTGSCSVRFDVI